MLTKIKNKRRHNIYFRSRLCHTNEVYIFTSWSSCWQQKQWIQSIWMSKQHIKENKS